jgi:hypothetical protein
MPFTERPGWVLGVALLALLWNLVGALPPEQRQIHDAMPAAVNVFFAIAVGAGLLGSLALLLARRWAAPLLLSLLGVVAQMGTIYATTPAWALTGARAAVFPLLLVFISLGLWLFARRAVGRGWVH